MPSGERIPVAVLGATGLVGRQLVRRLVGHPWFELRFVAASDRTVGQAYGTSCRTSQPPMNPVAPVTKYLISLRH